MNILVVDDDPLVCESMKMLLKLDGHQMDAAYSGGEALTKLDARRFDLVFTDYFMPQMRGDQLARAIRTRAEAPPVVMVTGYPPSPTPHEIARVVLKPFDLQSVRSAVGQFQNSPGDKQNRKWTDCPGSQSPLNPTSNVVVAQPGIGTPLQKGLAELEEQVATLMREKRETEEQWAARLRHIRHEVAQAVTLAQAFFEILPQVMEQEELVAENSKHPEFWLKSRQRAHQAIKAIPGMLKG